MDERPCTCGGSQDNCRYCFGRGYVPASRPLPSLNSTGGIRPGGRRRRPNHRPKVANTAVAIRLLTPSAASARKYILCANCGATLREDRAEGHLLRCPLRDGKKSTSAAPILSSALHEARVKSQPPGLSVKQEPPEGQVPKRKDPNSIVVCPACREKMKFKYVNRHQDHCSKLQKILTTIRKRRKRKGGLRGKTSPNRARGIPPTSADARKQRSYDQVSGRDRLDKSRNYGYPARETGRFGSHPGHDGFDDESGPS